MMALAVVVVLPIVFFPFVGLLSPCAAKKDLQKKKSTIYMPIRR
jgi:hypothetical protein